MTDARVTSGAVVKEAREIGYVTDWSYSRRGDNDQLWNIIIAGPRVTDCFKQGDYIYDLDIRTKAGKIRNEKFLRFLQTITFDGVPHVPVRKDKGRADARGLGEAIKEVSA